MPAVNLPGCIDAPSVPPKTSIPPDLHRNSHIPPDYWTLAANSWLWKKKALRRRTWNSPKSLTKNCGNCWYHFAPLFVEQALPSFIHNLSQRMLRMQDVQHFWRRAWKQMNPNKVNPKTSTSNDAVKLLPKFVHMQIALWIVKRRRPFVLPGNSTR